MLIAAATYVYRFAFCSWRHVHHHEIWEWNKFSKHMKKPLTYLSLLELNPVANFWILKKQNNPLIWMLHLSSYSHSCLVGLRASFYNFVLILATLETDVINRNIAFKQNLPLLSVVEATIYNQMMWNIELSDKSCPENYVGTYIIHIFSFIAECAQYFTDSHGMIRSPGYPSTIYQNIDCTWLIHFQDGKSIKLEIMDIFIEAGCLTKKTWSRWKMFDSRILSSK